jgi:AraC family transcriptional regulator of adaptative response/methylated-DNA-[protein]-cysteine methyltransferase
MVIERNSAISEDERWEAVLRRDRRYDGRFVTAVRTTGIYCRPSCPARTPKRENVTFYHTPAEAEGAGFRACKRCNPDQQAFEAQVTEQVCDYIGTHLQARLTLDELGGVVNVSPHHLQRVFKRATGITPKQYIDARRAEDLKARLKAGEGVTSAVYEAGYSSSSRVYEHSDARLGMTPAAYRKGGKGMEITYTIVECPLGYLLVGATERGICVVRLGDTAEELAAGLYADYPAAEIQEGRLSEWVEPLLEHLNGDLPHLELPLDVRATAFQWRVWEALRAIPYGETRTYSEVAQTIGNPKAVRAVANACAGNRVAVVIPCHRVVREDGDLGGYRWGLERKEWLLGKESAEYKVQSTE